MTDADRSVIGGRYQVIASLGKGGMGLVYKAYDPVLDRTVALKKMIATVVDSEEGRQRFYIEARAAARLNHPNIVTIHELEEYSGDIYIVMELLDGVSLAGFMRQRVDLTLAGCLTIIAQIADGLHYAHKRGIVHRDVKPANLVLTSTGNLKILDFGIARLASNEITRKGKLLGTPHYMAPEQVQEQPVDARADLFSLGAVAYELVTGIKAFAADSIPALLMQITSTPHRPVLEVAPETEPSLAAIIDRLLAKDRSERFLTGMEVIAALDLIGELDRIDLVAEAVAAVTGPSGEMTIYAPIGATPQPAGASTTPPAVPPSASDEVTLSLSAPPPVVAPKPHAAPPPVPASDWGQASIPPEAPLWPAMPSAAEDITLSLSEITPLAPVPPAVPPSAEGAAERQASTGREAASREEPVPTPKASPSAPQQPVGSPPDLPASKAPAFVLPDTIAAVPQPLPVPDAAASSSVPVPPPPAAPSVAPPSASPFAAAPPPAPLPASASAASAVKAPAPAVSSAPRGFVNTGVPQPRHRSGSGASIVVVGLLLLPAVAAAGWWAFNSVRGALQTQTTATDTTSPSTVKDSADPAAQKPSDAPVATTDQAKPGETPGETPAETATQDATSQQPAQNPPPADADATAAVKPPEGADPARPADASQTADANPATASQAADANRAAQTNQPPANPNASQAVDANRPAQTNQAPGANQANANQASANQASTSQPKANQGDATRANVEAREARNLAPPARDLTRDPGREPSRDPALDRTRETAPDTVVRDATRESTRTPGRDTTNENSRREPAPPVREGPPAEPSREPSTPADTRTLDYGSLSAFRGGSRSTGSASSVYSESPSTAAAVARITYALEAYGDAIAARDLDALRDVRSPVTPGETALLKEGRTTVRFSNLEVNVNGNDARVRCRRALVTNGKTVSSSPADVRLTRRPEGWVITEIR